MSTVQELTTARTPLGAMLKTGVDALAGGSSPITFTLYNRRVLPLDGFVFWVLSGLETTPPSAPTTVTVPGSYHLSTQKIQEETETYGVNSCVFTSELPIVQNLEAANPDGIYIGSFPDPQYPGTNLQFAFSRQRSYKQADLWHYTGDAVYPFMASQIINDAQDVPTDSLVVSNSLPFWLALNDYSPTLPAYGFGNAIPLYPAHLVAANLTPPFGAVNILSESTAAWSSAPYLSRRSTHSQLTREVVRVTLYGVNNDQALTFMDCVLQRSQDYGPIGKYFGILNCPTVRDEKVKQLELSILAQKKSIEFEVAYFQTSVRNVARQLIESAIPAVKPVWPASWPPDPYVVA